MKNEKFMLNSYCRLFVYSYLKFSDLLNKFIRISKSERQLLLKSKLLNNPRNLIVRLSTNSLRFQNEMNIKYIFELSSSIQLNVYDFDLPQKYAFNLLI